MTTTTTDTRKLARLAKSSVTFENCFIVKIDNDWAADDKKERKITGSFQQNDSTESKQMTLRFDSFDAIDEIYASLENQKIRYNLVGYKTWYDVTDEKGNKVTRDKLVIMKVVKVK